MSILTSLNQPIFALTREGIAKRFEYMILNVDARSSLPHDAFVNLESQGWQPAGVMPPRQEVRRTLKERNCVLLRRELKN